MRAADADPHRVSAPRTLMEKLAVKPELVRFTLQELVVRCPACRVARRWQLAAERPTSEPRCPGCGCPWRWA